MPEGIRSEVNPMAYAEGGAIMDLYVNHEGLQLLRDNTTRELSQYFDGLVKEAAKEMAEIDAERYDDGYEQDPLPGL